MIVQTGGTITGTTLLSGAATNIALGAIDPGSFIAHGASWLVVWSANGDTIGGSQTVSGATAIVTNETIENGGVLNLFLKGGIASGTIEATTVVSSGYGDLGVISAFGATDVIDEQLISATGAALVTTTSSGNRVETISGGTFPESFIFAGTAVAANIAMVADGTGGAELVNVACFASGTHIRTIAGEVAVEHLRVGDIVMTANGGARPLIWLGSRTLHPADYGNESNIVPIRIAAGALGPGLPARDLLLSREHAISTEGALIPVGELVNGCSINPVSVEQITYWHIELDEHDVLFAEGLPAERHLENDNHEDFEGGATVNMQPLRNGSEGASTMTCALVRRQGFEVELMRSILWSCIELQREAALAA